MSYFFTLDGKQLFYPDPPEPIPPPPLLTLKQAMYLTKEEYEDYITLRERYEKGLDWRL